MDIAALAGFAFVAAITPGPNNAMLLASGVSYGFRRTIPHMAGVTLGMVSLLLAIAFGLGSLFERYSWLGTSLRLVGSAYLLYLAYKIAFSGTVTKSSAARPLTFWEAAAFQYVNPKGWLFTIAAAATFLPSEGSLVTNALLFAATFGAMVVPAVVTWAAGGDARWLQGVGARMFAFCLLEVCGGE